MSRIHEAIQRASDEAGGLTSGSQTPFPTPITGADALALGRDLFPVEMPDRSRRAEEDRADGASPAPPSVAAGDDADASPFERIHSHVAEKVVLDENLTPVSREQYRRLAGVLHDAQETSGLKVVMITSAVAGEGKTLTAVNLSLTLSESYHKRVLLIDADLRRPTIHTIFKIKVSGGLTEGLEAKGEPKLVVRQVSTRLGVLPAGRPTSDPMAALVSTRMQRLVQEAKEAYDWVIIDTPPLVLLTDANLLAALADGTVLVVKAGSTPHHLVKRAVEAVGKNRIIGVVLNQAQTVSHIDYGGYHGYYLEGSVAPPVSHS